METSTRSRIYTCATSKNTRSLNRQGLFFYNGKLYESSGMFGLSKMTRYDIQNNVLVKKQTVSLDPKYFGEGAEFYEKNGKVLFYQLTWKNREMLPNQFGIRSGL